MKYIVQSLTLFLFINSVSNFRCPVVYKVTDKDGSRLDYTVTNTKTKSSAKQITTFSFTNLNPVVWANINQTTRKITATLEADVNLTTLTPKITVSDKAIVSPASGIAQNFSKGVVYTVTAEDGTTQTYEVNLEKRIVTPVPASLGLSTFYKKYLDASSIPVVSSQKVPDAALIQARNIVNLQLEKIIEKRPEILAMMKQNKLRVAVMAETELTTAIPEHSDLYKVFPGTDWDTRARGLGATIQRPAISCAEENLLCYNTDRYLGEDILIHEFAHSIHIMGINYIDKGFEQELMSIYKDALAKGLWANTYAASNHNEYWAEGVQSWYDQNVQAIPANGIHNEINSRAELKVYDPKLYELISRYFNEPTRKVSCHAPKF